MESRELLTVYRNKLPQRRKGAKKDAKLLNATRSLRPCFAPLRLCGKLLSYRTLFSLSITLLFSSSILAQTRRAMTPADILRVETVGDAQISPDGAWVVYTVS